MHIVDPINRVIGQNTISFCAEGIEQPWQLRRQQCLLVIQRIGKQLLA